MLDIHPKWLCLGGLQERFPILSNDVEGWANATFEGLRDAPFLQVWIALEGFIIPDSTVIVAPRPWVIPDASDPSGTLVDARTGEIMSLRKQSVKVAIAPVQSLLPTLIERLRRATAKHGRKTELAAWLGVHPQCVRDWIAGRKQPGGETALRLLHWVEQQERVKP